MKYARNERIIRMNGSVLISIGILHRAIINAWSLLTLSSVVFSYVVSSVTVRWYQSCHPCAAFVPSCLNVLLLSRRSAGYTQKRLTKNLKVPYYVGEQFSKEFTGGILKNLEQTVEDDYISNLRNNCWKEKQQSSCAIKTNCTL